MIHSSAAWLLVFFINGASSSRCPAARRRSASGLRVTQSPRSYCLQARPAADHPAAAAGRAPVHADVRQRANRSDLAAGPTKPSPVCPPQTWASTVRALPRAFQAAGGSKRALLAEATAGSGTTLRGLGQATKRPLRRPWHLASVLQEGRENAKIDVGFIWRISVKGGYHVPFRHNFNRRHCRHGAC